MKVCRMILLAFAIIANANLFAQNATKAELEALTQRVAKLEADLERVITENVNLVEQLKIKTLTSYTDKNGIQWDIVKVTPDSDEGIVILDIRVTNNSGAVAYALPFNGLAINSDSNLRNNSYELNIKYGNAPLDKLGVGIPVNFSVEIMGVPLNSSYLSSVELLYNFNHAMKSTTIKFTGIHIPR